jgi:lysophospholipase L1-like esterase
MRQYSSPWKPVRIPLKTVGKAGIGAVALAAVASMVWAALGYPIVFQGEKRAYDPAARGDLIPMAVGGLRNARCVLPAIPHLVTDEGYVPPNRRTRSFHYSTNALTYRGDREYQLEKRPGTYRVLVFGTGVSFGNGVDDEDVYSALLERRLNRAGDRTYEVYNLALPCSTTDVGVNELRRATQEYEYDFVVFCYGVNDGLPMFGKSSDYYARTLHELVRLKKEQGISMVVAIEPQSSFYPWPYTQYREQFDAIVGADPEMDVIDLPAILDEVERHHGLRLIREAGSQKVVEYIWGHPRTLFEVAYEAGAGQQAVSPDVYEFLDTHRVNQATFIDGVHLSEEGMRAVAEELYSFISSR